ncbi:hypothetical protein P154DRAFT_164846 [Amniculicola lignicola CBS 123094]|uniref:Uncharacterized protein n=1 Tax=Amniculicola lignicola CBS 123094 TaxID=1392246 RepID=A0A6A5WKM6_9PLEO|nr:hypothetical protein P154DRAFT_164846 [Amniculicola lignicola CBS 123094]
MAPIARKPLITRVSSFSCASMVVSSFIVFKCCVCRNISSIQELHHKTMTKPWPTCDASLVYTTRAFVNQPSPRSDASLLQIQPRASEDVPQPTTPNPSPHHPIRTTNYATFPIFPLSVSIIYCRENPDQTLVRSHGTLLPPDGT